MLDREKVIKGLQEAVVVINDHVPVQYVGYTEAACLDAITLLRKQEPVAPVCTEYDRSIVLFSCRDCKTQLLYGQRYCHMCGKAVKWN